MWVLQFTKGARWAVMREMSGDEGLPRLGRRVGVFEFNTQKELFSTSEEIDSTLASSIVEDQPAWCALKSPRMRVSSSECCSKGFRSGE